MNVVLFKSKERFSSFKKKLESYGIQPAILDFESHDWVDFDFSKTDFVIYYPSFFFSSNHPLALHNVQTNLSFLHERNSEMVMFPDPNLIQFYNDKYRQYLFLHSHRYPIPPTLPLVSEESLKQVEEMMGYPVVLKNRFGAGGGSVFKINNRREMEEYYKLSMFDFIQKGSLRFFWNLLSKRIFYWHLIRDRRMRYPFLSYPLLAQKFVEHEHDLKTVVGDGRVVEGHWRRKTGDSMWKVNIDGGGIGEWSHIPGEATDLSVRLARDLNASWLNIDLMPYKEDFLITEFSPVWHHYAYREKPSFVYKDDYNLDVPLEISLDLERIIIESMIKAVEKKRRTRVSELDHALQGVTQ
jgi:glutathione synthase/RimK-type ligase-like ATP-grasp enzyme